jgi:hypothetical protein
MKIRYQYEVRVYSGRAIPELIPAEKSIAKKQARLARLSYCLAAFTS